MLSSLFTACEYICVVCRILEEFPEGVRHVKFEGFNSRDEFMNFLEESGQIPLPPYIRNNDSSMKESYQTVFAKNNGSVAETSPRE